MLSKTTKETFIEEIKKAILDRLSLIFCIDYLTQL